MFHKSGQSYLISDEGSCDFDTEYTSNIQSFLNTWISEEQVTYYNYSAHDVPGIMQYTTVTNNYQQQILNSQDDIALWATGEPGVQVQYGIHRPYFFPIFGAGDEYRFVCVRTLHRKVKAGANILLRGRHTKKEGADTPTAGVGEISVTQRHDIACMVRR